MFETKKGFLCYHNSYSTPHNLKNEEESTQTRSRPPYKVGHPPPQAIALPVQRIQTVNVGTAGTEYLKRHRDEAVNDRLKLAWPGINN